MDGMMAERTAPTANRTASWPVTIGMFLLSLPVNALGNALTAVTSDRVASPGAAGSYLGAAYWTAGYYNIASILPDWVGRKVRSTARRGPVSSWARRSSSSTSCS